MRRIVFAFLVVLFVFAGHAWADDAGVSMQITADRSAAVAGDGFDIAIALTVPDGKHIYWSNPGDAGLATHFKFTPSAGITVGEVKYPLPMKFIMGTGQITDYGYQNEVTFLAHVTVANDAKEATISVKGSWLCCDDHGCTPGSGETSISVPMGTESAAVSADIFQKAVATLPGKQNIALDVKSQQLQGTTADDGKSESFHLAIQWNGAVKDVDVYPGASDELSVENISVKQDGTASTIGFDVRTLQGQTPKVDKLPMLVVYTTDKGQRRGFYVDADLKALQNISTK